MSGNSNLGYANLDPYINGQFTNANSSQYAGNFGSNETQMGLKGGKGTNSKWKNSVRRKIKNITRKYRKMAKKRSKSARKRMRSRYLRKSRNMKGGYTYKKRKTSRKSSRKTTGQKGGQYSQYGSNIPQPSGYSPNFNIGGNSALANPMSHTAGGVEANTYNHYKYSAV
jgi:hypothetical protein